MAHRRKSVRDRTEIDNLQRKLRAREGHIRQLLEYIDQLKAIVPENPEKAEIMTEVGNIKVEVEKANQVKEQVKEEVID